MPHLKYFQKEIKNLSARISNKESDDRGNCSRFILSKNHLHWQRMFRKSVLQRSSDGSVFLNIAKK